MTLFTPLPATQPLKTTSLATGLVSVVGVPGAAEGVQFSGLLAGPRGAAPDGAVGGDFASELLVSQSAHDAAGGSASQRSLPIGGPEGSLSERVVIPDLSPKEADAGEGNTALTTTRTAPPQPGVFADGGASGGKDLPLIGETLPLLARPVPVAVIDQGQDAADTQVASTAQPVSGFPEPSTARIPAGLSAAFETAALAKAASEKDGAVAPPQSRPLAPQSATADREADQGHTFVKSPLALPPPSLTAASNAVLKAERVRPSPGLSTDLDQAAMKASGHSARAISTAAAPASHSANIMPKRLDEIDDFTGALQNRLTSSSGVDSVALTSTPADQGAPKRSLARPDPSSEPSQPNRMPRPDTSGLVAPSPKTRGLEGPSKPIGGEPALAPKDSLPPASPETRPSQPAAQQAPVELASKTQFGPLDDRASRTTLAEQPTTRSTAGSDISPPAVFEEPQSAAKLAAIPVPALRSAPAQTLGVAFADQAVRVSPHQAVRASPDRTVAQRRAPDLVKSGVSQNAPLASALNETASTNRATAAAAPTTLSAPSAESSIVAPAQGSGAAPAPAPIPVANPATVPPTPAISPASPAITAPVTAEAAGPSLEQFVERIADAREAGRSVRPELTLRHGEFGSVGVRLDASASANIGDWRATLIARDPGFVPAVQVALAERSVAAASESGLTHGGSSSPRGGEGGSPNSGSNPSGSQSSSSGFWSGSQGSGAGQERGYGSSTGADQGSAKPYSGEEGSSGSNPAAADSGEPPLHGPEGGQGGAVFA